MSLPGGRRSKAGFFRLWILWIACISGVPFVLTSCGVTFPTSPATALVSGRDRGPKYRVVYNFRGALDGADPVGALTIVNGHFYGATISGGGYSCGYRVSCGTIFEVSPSGRERLVYRFDGIRRDGWSPTGGLVLLNGLLYGTTELGGTYNAGTIFDVSTSGKENIIANFPGYQSGGRQIVSGLTLFNSELFGTTYRGDDSDGCPCGSVFKINAIGKIHRWNYFWGGRDGASPNSPMIASGNFLYGTTQYGGRESNSGVVFKVGTAHPGRDETRVLYRFFGSPYDGSEPIGLAPQGDLLYGVTASGGADAYGTVFSLTLRKRHREVILHNFSGASDGAQPNSAPYILNGTLYGTTFEGPTSRYTTGEGIIYSVAASGLEKVLHVFGSSDDGAFPNGALVELNGSLYGTTTAGGTHGAGTIFKITP